MDCWIDKKEAILRFHLGLGESLCAYFSLFWDTITVSCRTCFFLTWHMQDIERSGWPVTFSVHPVHRLTVGAVLILGSINGAIGLHLQLEALATGKPGYNAL